MKSELVTGDELEYDMRKSDAILLPERLIDEILFLCPGYAWGKARWR